VRSSKQKKTERHSVDTPSVGVAKVAAAEA